VKECEVAQEAVRKAEEEQAEANLLHSKGSKDLQRSVLEQKGTYKNFQNDTAHTFAELEMKLQTLVHQEETARLVETQAMKDGNMEIAKVYGLMSSNLKQEIKSTAMLAVALKTRGIVDGQEKSPIVLNAEEGGGDNSKDPMWLKFAAHNMKLEESTRMMNAEMDIKRAQQSVKECERTRVMATDENPCTRVRASLNKAKADLLVAKARSHSIEGTFSNGLVGSTTERERRLEKEKDAMVDASMRAEDRRVEMETQLNETSKQMEDMKMELSNKKVENIFHEGAMEIMNQELNETISSSSSSSSTTSSYVRFALKFQPLISPTSDIFEARLITTLAIAFNTTESTVRLDLVKSLNGTSTTITNEIVRQNLRRRRLSSDVRMATAEEEEVLVHARLISNSGENSLEIAKLVRKSILDGVLEKTMEKENVGLKVILMGEVEAVVRE
jgi:hypothetical protein